MNYTEIIEDGYIVRTYDNGMVVKSLITEETDGQVIELPKNPLLALQEENNELKSIVDQLIIDNLNMQMQIDTLIMTSLEV